MVFVLVWWLKLLFISIITIYLYFIFKKNILFYINVFFRFMDSEALQNFELTCKLFREYVIQSSAWKSLTEGTFTVTYERNMFDSKSDEHIFYKKKYRMFSIVGHDCDESCYNCCNICLKFTDCFYLSFCSIHSWSDYLLCWNIFDIFCAPYSRNEDIQTYAFLFLHMRKPVTCCPMFMRGTFGEEFALQNSVK